MRRLMAPKWLLTHALALGLVVLFLKFGWWQLHRAEQGNTPSYAYALEWPTFAVLVVWFWLKIVRDGFTAEPADGTAATAAVTDSDIGANVDDADAAELAVYNRYLAELASRRTPR